MLHVFKLVGVPPTPPASTMRRPYPFAFVFVRCLGGSALKKGSFERWQTWGTMEDAFKSSVTSRGTESLGCFQSSCCSVLLLGQHPTLCLLVGTQGRDCLVRVSCSRVWDVAEGESLKSQSRGH